MLYTPIDTLPQWENVDSSEIISPLPTKGVRLCNSMFYVTFIIKK